MPRRSAKAKPPATADAYVERIIGQYPNALIPHYLLACYTYYVMDNPLISDRLFDHITKRLISEWPALRHIHKDRITMDDLMAGTGFAMTYPSMTIGAANHMAMLHQNGELR